MPIRSYTCSSCGEQFEIIHRTRMEYDSTITHTCPECSSPAPADAMPLVARRNPDRGIQR